MKLLSKTEICYQNRIRYPVKYLNGASCENNQRLKGVKNFCKKLHLRCLAQDVLKRSRRVTTKQDFVTTSEKRRRIYDVFKTSDLQRLEDI